ncbi:MAG: glycerol-3-phosphate dehydrogenase, partial [Alphaproteobacteria bacterium]|nr:glycerol-3-phosphate dehydrogenase [Alphaproteobacteria bacterium]
MAEPQTQSPDRSSTPYDILIVGGGVNGAGIARDAAGRNLRVLLCEMNDLGSGTSSASTKLIHGGLRYLEYYEFRLVRESLGERETLLRAAPHIIWPMRFVLPHHKGLRPRWLLRLGLFLYDHLGKREILPGTASLKLREDTRGAPLKDEFTHGFAYSDCWVEDSRLVVLNARDAANLGADIRTRTRCAGLEVRDGLWQATLTGPDGAIETVSARAVVNAAGPWVDEVMGQIQRNDLKKDAPLRLVKGSHAIVERLYEGEHAYIFQNTDGRILFAIPYEGRFTLLGTTDVPFEGDPSDVSASDEEIGYICRSVSEYFKTPVTPDQVVHRYSGVRPLYDESITQGAGGKNASAVTRDYVFDLQAQEGLPPLLSIYGGKITTFRKLAEHALKELQPHLGFDARPWTGFAPLPGGDI